MKLINNVLNLKSMDKAWLIPNEEENGNIESSGQVLAVKQRKDCSFGYIVKLQERGTRFKNCNFSSDSEKWFRSKKDERGFFTLQNLATGKYLTADEKRKFIVTGTQFIKILLTIFVIVNFLGSRKI